jgi:hypothetical protein
MAQGSGGPEANPPVIPEKFAQINAPLVSASSVAFQSTGNEYLLIFQRPRPVLDLESQALAQVAYNEVVAVVGVSAQTLKDLALLLNDAVANHERDYGEIITPYVKRRQAERGES